MSASPPPAAPLQEPQRLCPRCSTIARTVEPECPFCRSSYTRRGPWGTIAAATLLTIAATLAGVALLLSSFGDSLDQELDEEVTSVQRDFDRDVQGLEERILRELDARLPAAAPGG